MLMKCEHFIELMRLQRDIINRHIDEHKYFQGIEDKNQAVIDFIQKYGYLMREVFCLRCQDRDKCGYDPSEELYSKQKH